MFRCPDCGQGKEVSFIIPAGVPVRLIMKDEMDEVETVIVDGEGEAAESPETFVETFKTSEEQDIECAKCSETHTIEEWRDAHAEPLKYFEMENEQLCHCGGELWMDQIPGTRTYGFVCEDCDWVKPKKVVSGA